MQSFTLRTFGEAGNRRSCTTRVKTQHHVDLTGQNLVTKFIFGREPNHVPQGRQMFFRLSVLLAKEGLTD